MRLAVSAAPVAHVQCAAPASAQMDDAEPEWHVKTRGYKVGCFLAGSTDGAYILSVAYKPRKGAKAKRAASNHHLYRRTWPTREEAELPANVEAFRRFVEGGLGQGGGGARRSDPAALETLLSRGAAATKVAKAMRFAEVSRRRVEAAGGHLVTPKPRGASRPQSEGGGHALGLRRPLFSRTNHKVRAQKTKRRQAALVKAVGRAASNAAWLQRQIAHLATAIPREAPWPSASQSMLAPQVQAWPRSVRVHRQGEGDEAGAVRARAVEGRHAGRNRRRRSKGQRSGHGFRPGLQP